MCILYNQRDATYTNFLYYCQRSICFGRLFRPSSGAYKTVKQPWVLSCFPAVYRWCGWAGTESMTIPKAAHTVL